MRAPLATETSSATAAVEMPATATSKASLNMNKSPLGGSQRHPATICQAKSDGQVTAGAFSAVRNAGVEIAPWDVQTTRRSILAEPSDVLIKSPENCTTKEDVRAELDRIDQALLTLFAERHAYVTRMASIKTDPHEAHDP
eukprot:gene15249-biopygen13523